MDNSNEVLVWGAGMHALSFIAQTPDIDVIAFIDSNKKGSFLGKKIYSPEECNKFLRHHFVVIASSDDAFWEIRQILEMQGLEEFKDYCFYGVYNKSIAVAYGNCHMTAIKRGLLQSNEFCKRFGFYPIRPICEIKRFNLNDLSSVVFERCDLLLHQSIRKENKYGQEYSSEHILKNATGQIISVPNLHHMPMCFFPQIDYEKKKVGEELGFLNREDTIMTELINQGLSVEEIVDYIQNGEPFKSSDVLCRFDNFVEKLVRREAEWDIKVSDWILKNYKVKPIFYDPGHPTNDLLIMVVNQLLGFLKISCNTIEVASYYDQYEEPVYGQVKRTLGLSWDNNGYIRCHVGDPMFGRRITLTEYVKEYIFLKKYEKF